MYGNYYLPDDLERAQQQKQHQSRIRANRSGNDSPPGGRIPPPVNHRQSSNIDQHRCKCTYRSIAFYLALVLLLMLVLLSISLMVLMLVVPCPEPEDQQHNNLLSSTNSSIEHDQDSVLDDQSSTSPSSSQSSSSTTQAIKRWIQQHQSRIFRWKCSDEDEYRGQIDSQQHNSHNDLNERSMLGNSNSDIIPDPVLDIPQHII